MVAADHPQSAIILQDPAALGQPRLGEGVVGLEAVEVIPLVVHSVDDGVVWTGKLAAELEIVGWISEHQVHRLVRQPRQRLDAVADNDAVWPQIHGTPLKLTPQSRRDVVKAQLRNVVSGE